jgi:cytochrome c
LAAAVAVALTVTLAVAPSALGAATPKASAAKVPAGPGLGTPATPEEIAGWDISIPPNGDGLPPGKGTPEQGAPLYAANCASCHGASGEGSTAEELVGGQGSLAGPEPTLTVGSYWPYATTLFDYVRRAMPPEAPLSLTADEVYAVSAYLLYLNKIIPKDAEMNATTLPAVEMPNRDGFVPVYRGLGRKAR